MLAFTSLFFLLTYKIKHNLALWMESIILSVHVLYYEIIYGLQNRYFNFYKLIRSQTVPLVLFLSLLVVPYSSDLLLLDFLDEEFLGEAEALLAASGVSSSDRMSVMLSSSAETSDPGSAVVVVGGAVLLTVCGLHLRGPVSVVPDSKESK